MPQKLTARQMRGARLPSGAARGWPLAPIRSDICMQLPFQRLPRFYHMAARSRGLRAPLPSSNTRGERPGVVRCNERLGGGSPTEREPLGEEAGDLETNVAKVVSRRGVLPVWKTDEVELLRSALLVKGQEELATAETEDATGHMSALLDQWREADRVIRVEHATHGPDGVEAHELWQKGLAEGGLDHQWGRFVERSVGRRPPEVSAPRKAQVDGGLEEPAFEQQAVELDLPDIPAAGLEASPCVL
jgi:hypothetical protein